MYCGNSTSRHLFVNRAIMRAGSGRSGWLPIALTLLISVSVGACGGTVGGGEDELALRAGSSGALSTLVKDERIIVKEEGSDVAVVWAAVADGDNVGFSARDGSAYSFVQAGDTVAPSLKSEQSINGMVVGGRVSKGAQIGLPSQVVVDGQAVPHVLIVLDSTQNADTGDGTVRYVFAPCSEQLCTKGPIKPKIAEAPAGKQVDLGDGLRLVATPQADQQFFFVVSREGLGAPANASTEAGAASESTTPAAAAAAATTTTAAASAATTTAAAAAKPDVKVVEKIVYRDKPAPPPEIIEKDGDSNWWAWMLAGAAVVGGVWVATTDWSDDSADEPLTLAPVYGDGRNTAGVKTYPYDESPGWKPSDGHFTQGDGIFRPSKSNSSI